MMYDDEHLEAEYAAYLCFAGWAFVVAIACAITALAYAWMTI